MSCGCPATRRRSANRGHRSPPAHPPSGAIDARKPRRCGWRSRRRWPAGTAPTTHPSERSWPSWTAWSRSCGRAPVARDDGAGLDIGCPRGRRSPVAAEISTTAYSRSSPASARPASPPPSSASTTGAPPSQSAPAELADDQPPSHWSHGSALLTASSVSAAWKQQLVTTYTTTAVTQQLGLQAPACHYRSSAMTGYVAGHPGNEVASGSRLLRLAGGLREMVRVTRRAERGLGVQGRLESTNLTICHP